MALEEMGVAHGVRGVGGEQIRLEPLWGLIRHLYPSLQYRHGEFLARVGGQPESERGVNLLLSRALLGFQALAYSLEGGHPAGGQVAVLEEHPEAAFLGFLYCALGYGALALAQGDLLHAV